jgi:hypothetical protein
MMEINYEELQSLTISDLVSLRDYTNYKFRVETVLEESKLIKQKLVSLKEQLELKINNLFII